MMRDFKKTVDDLRIHEKLFNESDAVNVATLYRDAADAIEELLRIGAKMHTWIFLNTADEQAAYDEIGLTDEQNALFGYSGQMILKAVPPQEVE